MQHKDAEAENDFATSVKLDPGVKPELDKRISEIKAKRESKPASNRN
jgi:hypothetical protein